MSSSAPTSADLGQPHGAQPANLQTLRRAAALIRCSAREHAVDAVAAVDVAGERQPDEFRKACAAPARRRRNRPHPRGRRSRVPSSASQLAPPITIDHRRVARLDPPRQREAGDVLREHRREADDVARRRDGGDRSARRDTRRAAAARSPTNCRISSCSRVGSHVIAAEIFAGCCRRGPETPPGGRTSRRTRRCARRSTAPRAGSDRCRSRGRNPGSGNGSRCDTRSAKRRVGHRLDLGQRDRRPLQRGKRHVDERDVEGHEHGGVRGRAGARGRTGD